MFEINYIFLISFHRYIVAFRKDDKLFNKHLQHNNQKRRKNLIVIIALMLLILIPLCIVATYTWISISKTPKVSDMEMTINSSPGLQLAWSQDAAEEDWKHQLDFLDVVSEDTVLYPVTWSDTEDSFYTARFGTDGRMVDTGIRLSDDEDSNSSSGHYVKFTVYGRTSQNVNVSLSPAVEVNEGTGSAGTYLIGSPKWDSDSISHVDGGSGAQYATRIGFKISKIGENSVSDPQMYIYEPNYDKHIEYVGNNPSAPREKTLVSEDRLIRQSTSYWEESDPIERGVVIRRAGIFERDVTLFQLDEEEMVKIDVYLWLEGTDKDCVNAVGRDAQILANIQFAADVDNVSGLVPIE